MSWVVYILLLIIPPMMIGAFMLGRHDKKLELLEKRIQVIEAILKGEAG